MLSTANPTATPTIYSFSTPEGYILCRQLISKKLDYDPHDYQLEGVCKALDGIDVLAVTPTGSGTTGFLTMYLLIMHAIMDNPSLCAPRKPPSHFRKDGAMVVVCPTKSLELDMEPKFLQAGLRTLVINKDTADKERRKNNADIWDRAPEQHVLLLAPEQLSSKGFEHLMGKKCEGAGKGGGRDGSVKSSGGIFSSCLCLRFFCLLGAGVSGQPREASKDDVSALCETEQEKGEAGEEDG